MPFDLMAKLGTNDSVDGPYRKTTKRQPMDYPARNKEDFLKQLHIELEEAIRHEVNEFLSEDSGGLFHGDTYGTYDPMGYSQSQLEKAFTDQGMLGEPTYDESQVEDMGVYQQESPFEAVAVDLYEAMRRMGVGGSRSLSEAIVELGPWLDAYGQAPACGALLGALERVVAEQYNGDPRPYVRAAVEAMDTPAAYEWLQNQMTFR